jgi:hypothetical protein
MKIESDSMTVLQLVQQDLLKKPTIKRDRMKTKVIRQKVILIALGRALMGF